MPGAVRAIVVKSYKLVIIDEATGQPVIGICSVPEHLVKSTAAVLSDIMPTLRTAADMKKRLAGLFAAMGMAQEKGPVRRRKGR
jgi:hypothetical protein